MILFNSEVSVNHCAVKCHLHLRAKPKYVVVILKVSNTSYVNYVIFQVLSYDLSLDDNICQKF